MDNLFNNEFINTCTCTYMCTKYAKHTCLADIDKIDKLLNTKKLDIVLFNKFYYSFCRPICYKTISHKLLTIVKNQLLLYKDNNDDFIKILQIIGNGAQTDNLYNVGLYLLSNNGFSNYIIQFFDIILDYQIFLFLSVKLMNP